MRGANHHTRRSATTDVAITVPAMLGARETPAETRTNAETTIGIAEGTIASTATADEKVD